MNLIVDMNSRKDSLGYDEFVRPIVSSTGESEVRHYLEIGDVSSFDRIVLSGTPLKDNEYIEHLDAFKWLKKCERPVLGICAGMQALAAVHGAKLEKCPEIGMEKIRTLEENPLFAGEFEAYELHNYAVKSSKKFIALARSKNCIQAIKHAKLPQFGILFHPEIRNREMLERFAQI